jgi:hypothetical protein
MVWKNDRNRGQKLLLHSHIFGGFWGLDVGFLGRFDCDLKLVSPTGSVWKLMWSRIWSLVVVLMDFGFWEKREKMELFGGVSCAVFCLVPSLLGHWNWGFIYMEGLGQVALWFVRVSEGKMEFCSWDILYYFDSLFFVSTNGDEWDRNRRI